MLVIKILGTQCDVSNYYLKVVEEIATKQCVEFSIEKVEDEELIENYGLSINCLHAYCPGCRTNNSAAKDKNTPAMVINDRLMKHSYFPTDEEITEAIRTFYKSGKN